MKIIFMGTPEFAVPSLEALIKSGEDVAATITQPDKPKGRGKIISPPPVKEIALKYNIPVLQPEKIRDEAFIKTIKDLHPDIAVVIAYGKILPKAVLDIPLKGCVNVHASLLPKYRGAAPINHAIINGDKETGITTMLMDEGMDTGSMLLSEKVEIKDDDTAGDLHDRLKQTGAALLMRTIAEIKRGAIKPVPQDNSQATYAPMLKKEGGRIDWGLDADAIRNLIRGLTPWPGAYTEWNGMNIKILTAAAHEGRTDDRPGTVTDVTADRICVATGNGVLRIAELQPESRKKMSASDFINGYKAGGHKIGKGQVFN